MALTRIKGCSGELVLWAEAADRTTDPEKKVIDMTSFTLSESAENSTFNVIGDCAEQSGEGTTAYTVSGDGIVATDTTGGQAIIENGKIFQWRFYMDKATEADAYYEGNARVDSREMSVEPTENMSFTFSATGDGALIKSNVP